MITLMETGQTSLDIGYLGPEGTFTHEAADKFVQILKLQNANLISIESLEYLIYCVAKGEVDSAVVPLKNSIAGDYVKTLEGLANHNFKELSRLELQIVLGLGIHPDSDVTQITEAQSYPTALAECSYYLLEHFPSAKTISVDSTARAMKNIRDQGLLHVAAIGSAFGISFYGLNLVDNGIENTDKPNITTFLYLARDVSGVAK